MLKKKIFSMIPRLTFLKASWIIPILSTILIALSLLTVYTVRYSGKIYPNIFVAGISVSGLSPLEAEGLLREKVVVPKEISVVIADQTTNLPTSSLSPNYDFSASVQRAYFIFRSGNIFVDIYQRLLAPAKITNIPLVVSVDEKALNEALSIVVEGSITEPIYPSVNYIGGKILVEKGKEGTEADTAAAGRVIIDRLKALDGSPVFLAVSVINPSIGETEADELVQRARLFVGKSLELTFEQDSYLYKEEQIFKFLSPEAIFNNKELVIFVDALAEKLNREPQNPTFIFKGGRVEEFAPSRAGVGVKKDELVRKIIEALDRLEKSEENKISLEIPVEMAQPKIQTGDVNNLGIKELLGRGVSTFYHSISNRIHNISLASSKFNGILVAPGEVFSFNDALGDVSVFTGYKQAFVIKDGKTVLGDGGGVCQVSSTLFRVALNAGLPIVERRAHSYRVGYYEQNSPPGLDATVFAPTTDLKFQNDTPGHLLIQTSIDSKTYTLVFEIYGTSDGRVATVSKPVVTGVSTPPEDLYVDDPTLPAGQIKQIDFKAWGARVSFNYTVEKGGNVIYEKTFLSNYRPWQAIFLRGTGVTQ